MRFLGLISQRTWQWAAIYTVKYLSPVLKFQRYGQAASKSTWQLTAAKEASHHSSPSVPPYERLQPLFVQFATWLFSKSISPKKIKTEITKKIIGFCWAQVFIKQSGKQKTGRKGRKLTEHQEGSRVSPPGRQPCWVSSHISHPAKGQPAVQTAGIPEQIAQTGSCARKKGQSRTLLASQQKKEKSIPFPQ